MHHPIVFAKLKETHQPGVCQSFCNFQSAWSVWASQASLVRSRLLYRCLHLSYDDCIFVNVSLVPSTTCISEEITLKLEGYEKQKNCTTNNYG